MFTYGSDEPYTTCVPWNLVGLGEERGEEKSGRGGERTEREGKSWEGKKAR